MKVQRENLRNQLEPAKRGEVFFFSRASRKRLLELCSRLDPEKAVQRHPAVFLTLTYAREFPEPAEAKRHLRAFLERLRRRFERVSGFWRLEPQKRGAPHFHLVIFNLPWVPWWLLRQWWEEVTCFSPYLVESGPVEHLRIKIEAIESMRKLVYYVGKYCAKLASGEDGAKREDCFLVNAAYLHAGRFWGIFNGAKLPMAELRRWVHEGGRWVWKVKRAARKIYRRMFKFMPGFTLFFGNHQRMIDWVEQCRLEPARMSGQAPAGARGRASPEHAPACRPGRLLLRPLEVE